MGLEPESCEKGARDPQTKWTEDIRLARSTGMTECKDIIVQMVEEKQHLSKVTQQVAYGTNECQWHTLRKWSACVSVCECVQ